MSSIRDRRTASLLNRAFRKLAKSGKFPKFSAVFKLLSKLVGKDKNGSMLEPARFERGSPFPLEEFNKNLEDIAQEFQILYDESLIRSSRIIEEQVIVEEQVAEIRRQLLNTRAATQRELLLAASNFLDAIVINFTNRALIDFDETTAAVDTETGVVTLPLKAGAKRIIPPAVPSAPLEVDASGQDFQVLSGSSFAALFSDTLANWQVTTQSNKLRIKFSVGGLIHTGRIRIASPDEHATIELRTSPDGINFIRVDSRTVTGGVADFVFEERQITHLELLLTQAIPADSDGLVFTLDSIAMFSVGYQNLATIQTNELSPTSGGNIKVAAVDIDADVPVNTFIDIAVSAGGSDFRKIEDSIVNFTDSKTNNVFRRATASLTTLYSFSTVLGARSYTLAPLAKRNLDLSINDVFGVEEAAFFGNTAVPSNIDRTTAKLFRENCWGVASQTSNEVKTTINRMSMNYGERRLLYVQTSDEQYENGDTAVATLTLKRDIANGVNIPLSGSLDARIIKATGSFNYARWPDPGAGDFPRFTATVRVEGNGADRIVYVEDTSTQIPAYLTDYDSIFIETIGDVEIVAFDSTTKRIDLDPQLAITPGAYAMKVTNRDLTNRITSIAGRVITFSVSLREYEKVIITYNTPVDGTRFVPIGPSVVVRSARDPSIIARPDVDYRVSGNYIELLQTHTLPTDGAGSTSSSKSSVSIDVQFDYVFQESSLFSYWTYVTVPANQNKVIKISPLTLVHEERVLWTDPTGKVVDLEGLEMLVLSPGVHRFSVVGIRAINDDGVLDPNSALYLLVNLQGADGGYVFDRTAQYIERITGYPEPLTQTNRFYLERGAKKDNTTHFNWDNGSILTVFKMDKPVDAVILEPGNGSVVAGADYRLQYRYYNGAGVGSMIVKATLRRDQTADVGLTPVLRGMTIRFTE